MAALGHFWQRDYERALAAARVVADGDSKDRDFARYILAQIHHAQGKPADAIAWYHKVETLYPDAKEAIGYFEEKRISLEEVNLFKPAEPVQLKIKYRNIKDAAMQVYKVDLMKLYLREKNLSGMTKVQLSGIKPEAELQLHLGDGKDYVDKETIAKLPLKDEAAYLVICRGDDLFTSAVVLITPLKIEVQEDAVSGRLRANVIDSVKNSYVPEVHVKAIGSGHGLQERADRSAGHLHRGRPARYGDGDRPRGRVAVRLLSRADLDRRPRGRSPSPAWASRGTPSIAGRPGSAPRRPSPRPGPRPKPRRRPSTSGTCRSSTWTSSGRTRGCSRSSAARAPPAWKSSKPSSPERRSLRMRSPARPARPGNACSGTPCFP